MVVINIQLGNQFILITQVAKCVRIKRDTESYVYYFFNNNIISGRYFCLLPLYRYNTFL